MKLPTFALLVPTLGFGIAVGSYIRPTAEHLEASFRSTSDEITGAAPGNRDTSDLLKNGVSGTGELPPPGSGNEGLSSILNETNSFNQARSLLAYVRSVSSENFPNAIEEIEKNSSDTKSLALSLLIARWVEIDPAGAQAAISSTQDRGAHKILVRDVYGAMAAHDPTGALSSAQQLPTGEDRDRATLAIIQKVTQQDPAQAYALYKNLKPIPGSPLKTIFRAWANKDLAQATQAAWQLPHASDRTRAIESIATQLAQKDPSSALALIDQLSPGDEKNNAREDVIDQWGATDPAKAATYFQTLPDGSERQNAIPLIVGQWTQADPVAASNWLAQLSPGPSRDAAVTSFCAQVVADDPGGAYQWAKSISDANARQQQVTDILQKWMQIDPANASLAVQGSFLSPDQKNRLLQATH